MTFTRPSPWLMNVKQLGTLSKTWQSSIRVHVFHCLQFKEVFISSICSTRHCSWTFTIGLFKQKSRKTRYKEGCLSSVKHLDWYMWQCFISLSVDKQTTIIYLLSPIVYWHGKWVVFWKFNTKWVVTKLIGYNCCLI